VTGVQTCALPIYEDPGRAASPMCRESDLSRFARFCRTARRVSPRERAGYERRILYVGIEKETLERAEAILGHTFKDRELLEIGLTHASIADSRRISNERLEFLGDAVLGMLVCEHLYNRFPDLLEGDLTKIKSAAVSRRMCAKIAESLKLDDLLLLGKGMKTRASLPSSLAAAVLESAIGALYMDAGIDATRDFLMPLLAPHIDQAAESGHQQNFKSVLQQHAQREFGESPNYLLIDEKGPDHAKAFSVCVELQGDRFESCWAPSKKQAEQQAALLALESLDLIERDEEGHIIYTPSGEASANGVEHDAEPVVDTSE